jgi:hypothetical protein
MPLGEFVAGRYSGAYDSADVGMTKDPGYELSQTAKGEVIDDTDAYAKSIIDWVYQGGDVNLQFTSREYKTGALAAFWPYGSLGVMSSSAAPMGRLASDIAKAMVLTATASTPAATKPASLTGSLAILSPNFDARLLFFPKLREVPVRLSLLPSVSSGTARWFTTT